MVTRLMVVALGLMFWAATHSLVNLPPGKIQSAPSQSDAGKLTPGSAFEGDMYATMPQDHTRPSTDAEDQERAVRAATCVRVIFDTNSQPQFAALVKSALQKRWDPHLGYQLVFGESRGPLEEAATAVTYRMSVQAHAQQYNSSLQPYHELLFSSVDLTVHSTLSAKMQNWFPPHVGYLWCNPLPASWDDLAFSCDAPLPRGFSYRQEELEGLNRRQLWSLYQNFGLKLNEVPAFCFFPDHDFDRIRDLYLWPNLNGTNPPVDPLVFAQIATNLISKYKQNPVDPGRACLDTICFHLLDTGATNYLAGVSLITDSWSPGLSDSHLRVLIAYRSFGNYGLMEHALTQNDGYLLIENMPDIWNDPVLGYWLRSYLRKNAHSTWLAVQYADKLKSAPVSSPPQTVSSKPKPKPVIIILSPSSVPARTNHMASLN
ncbi:MAG TPA: hypothetical protein VMH87_16435 [Pseudomonadales bacterium]|nr:hypothetical protein [Pseudomonadales bacterium]